jgi:serine/threonine protein kinase
MHGYHCLVTEYVVGTDLHSLVTQHGPLPVEQAVECVDQAACGLGRLHLLKVWHRNVSPKNLLVDLQGRIKVTNLFLARIEENALGDAGGAQLTHMGDTMGTVEYLAPEQSLDASSVDQRADIYSLGCTLHFLLIGQPVYRGRSSMEKMLAHRKQPIPSLRAPRADVPDWLDQVFQKMVAKDPFQRFASMAEVSQAIAPRPPQSLWSRLRRSVLSIRWPFHRTKS